MEINEKKLKEILRGERQEFQKYVDKKLEKQMTIQREEFQSFVGKQMTIQREEFLHWLKTLNLKQIGSF